MKLLKVGIGNEALVEREIQHQLLAAVHLDTDRDPVQVVSVARVVPSRVSDLRVFRGVKEPRPRQRVPRELSTRGGVREGVLCGQDQELAAEEQHHRRRGYHRGHLVRDRNQISTPL